MQKSKNRKCAGLGEKFAYAPPVVSSALPDKETVLSISKS